MKYISQRTGLYTKLKLGNQLGAGKFGTVYEILDNEGLPTKCVCKHIEIKALSNGDVTRKEVLRSTINEIYALKKMGLLEGYLRRTNYYLIIMKKIKGNVPNIDDVDSAQPSFNAIRDCHRKNIAHFDTHTHNFLQRKKKNQEFKNTAIDFGASQNATFFNIFLDSYFYVGRQLDNPDYRSILPKLFIHDFFNYAKKNIFEVFMTIVWWSVIIYGALYGIPTLNLPHYYFYEYLKSKLYYQAFLELRSIGLTYEIFSALLLKPFINNEAIFNNLRHHRFQIFKHLFKPFYLLGLYFPYTHLKSFWELITNANGFPLQNPIVSSSAIFTCFNTALLYYPLKAGAEFIHDAVIQPLEPEAFTHAKADLYFQYNPILYIKAAMHAPEKNIFSKEKKLKSK